MAKRILSTVTFTPTAYGDTSVDIADTLYGGAIQGGSATQRVNILEVYQGGQAGSSSPTIMLLSRDSQVAVTTSLTGTATDASLDASTAALAAAPLAFNTATTKPRRSSSLHLLNLSFNAFGGIVRWLAAPGEEISIIGNTASLGEVSLSAYTGGTPGLMGCHIVYEPW